MKRLWRIVKRLLGWDKRVVYWKRGGRYVEEDCRRSAVRGECDRLWSVSSTSSTDQQGRLSMSISLFRRHSGALFQILGFRSFQ